jgi:iron complex outermembrane receptor protein
MRSLFLYIMLLIPIVTTGQSALTNDTIHIREIVIKGSLLSSGNGGYKQTILDSSLLRDYSFASLSDLLSETTPVFIKSYGTGGVATTSFRGTGANHTQIAWNGINISSPMSAR